MRVIIAEKTEAGEAIARVLSGGDYQVREIDGITVFSFGDTVVVPARGHLIDYKMHFPRRVSLDDLPVDRLSLDVAPTMPTRPQDRELRRQNAKRLEVIGALLERAEEAIVATDWDREGEVIGFRILEWFGRAEGPWDVSRAYFSALTPEFIERAFEGIEPMSEALLVQGMARGLADVLIGLNLTKAMTLVFRRWYPRLGKAINTGRVRSPLLSYVVRSTRMGYRERGEVLRWDSRHEKCYLKGPEGWIRADELSGFEDGPVLLSCVSEDVEEVPQAELLPNTDDAVTGLKIKPDVLMNQILEPMYLSGLMTYPRTRNRFCISEEFFRRCEEEMKARGLVPDSFSVDHSPAIDLESPEFLSVPEEERKKLPLMLTPEGIRALDEGRLSRAEEFVARWLLAKMARSMAPPLRVRKLVYIFEQGGRRVEVVWGEDVENPEDCVSGRSLTRRPLLEEGQVYELVKFSEVSEDLWISGAFEPSGSRLDDTDMVRWMVDADIGTPATRHEYPETLRRTGFLNDANLPTRLGTVTAEQFLERIGLDERLTAEMERRIERLKRLDELDGFREWVLGITRRFIERIGELQYEVDLRVFFRCPQNHPVELVWRRGRLFGICHTCDRVYLMG